VGVGEDLDLDVTGILEVLLDVDRGIGEIRLSFPARGVEGALDVLALADDAEALAASAGRGLDRERPAELVAEPADPGMIGTPATFIRSRASVFEPIASIAPGGGPIQTRPAASTVRANTAFSARNP
jgi:hypothetical protein